MNKTLQTITNNVAKFFKAQVNRLKREYSIMPVDEIHYTHPKSISLGSKEDTEDYDYTTYFAYKESNKDTNNNE